MEDLLIWVRSDFIVLFWWLDADYLLQSGNVSYEVPGFHGGFYIHADGVNHTPQFTAGAGSEDGFQRSLHCAAGMAVVASRALVDENFATAIKSDFEKGL